MSVDHNVFDNLKVRFSNILSAGWRNNNGGLSYSRNPIFPVYNEDGSYYLTNSQDYYHPLAITENQLNKSKTLDVISSVALEWQIIPELRLTSQANYKFGKSTTDKYYPKVYTEVGTMNNGQGEISNWEGNNIVWDTFANFSKTIKKHELGAMVGYSWEYSNSRSSNLVSRDFVNESLMNENMGAGSPEKNTLSNDYSTSTLLSGMFRLNYAYNNRYLVTLTARADGSSKFGENNKWAFSLREQSAGKHMRKTSSRTGRFSMN